MQTTFADVIEAIGPVEALYAHHFDYEVMQRHRAMEMDLAFKVAMIRARKRGLERFTIGVDDRPGTTGPYTVFEPIYKIPLIRSAAALCAECAASEEIPERTVPSMGHRL